MMTDPIADMLTRIRNALQAGHGNVLVPGSKVRRAIARILEEQGYVDEVRFHEDDRSGVIEVRLKYVDENEPMISGLRRISKPGRRVYRGKDDLPVVLNGLGIAIMSTSKGVLTDRECREAGVGGEVLCEVW